MWHRAVGGQTVYCSQVIQGDIVESRKIRGGEVAVRIQPDVATALQTLVSNWSDHRDALYRGSTYVSDNGSAPKS